MGDSIFSVGDAVRIIDGSFVGVVGIVARPSSDDQSDGRVVLAAKSAKQPVTVATVVDGQSFSLRVPPELLERY